jgi:hypothetical protein
MPDSEDSGEVLISTGFNGSNHDPAIPFAVDDEAIKKVRQEHLSYHVATFKDHLQKYDQRTLEIHIRSSC